MTSASAPPPWRQIIAGRALLAWSQADLASAANLGASVVHELEVNGRETNPGVFDTLRAALEVAGISFGEREPEFSQSRSVEPRSDRGQPLRWIQATDLEQWADTRAGQQDLPELLSRLLRAENGASARLRFPSGDSVTHAGWDGLSYVERQQPYTPAGWTGWELGAQRAKITAKANIDYQHRTDDPLGRVREETSFVFVTPRRWRDKDKWLAARRTEGQWRDVVAYDAEDLVHWIELYPAVAYWLADRIDKRPPGVRALADVWDQWSGATRRPLTEELTRLGRDEEAMRVLRWLSGPADTLLVQAETTEEALAFLFSCIEMLPETDRDAVLSHALVPSDAPSALTLSEAAPPLILGLRDGDVGFARTLSRKGHHVYLTVEAEVDRGEVLHLPPVPRWALSDGLRNMGFNHFEASNLARDAGRSLTILRRLLPPAAGRRPTWPGAAEARPTMAALLLGGWYEDSTADLEAVETLAGVPYEAFSREAARLLVERGGPLLKIDRVWKLASPLDAWFSGAEGLTEADIGRFLALAHEVLSVRDPAFDMPLSERWLAPIQPRGPHHSGLLRRAVADTLILLELYGGRARLAPKASKRTRDLLTDLLGDADDALWWSLADVLRQLAEASPAAFLAAVDRALMAQPSPLLSLFECDERTHSTAHVGQLLWSLERLAWDPALLESVADILARLDALDPGGRNMARPAASLRRIFLSWTPQTNASLEQRLTILDLLRAQHPQTAWRLLIAILPQPHSMSMPSDYPRWRDFGADEREILTHDLVEACVDAVAERMCADVGADVARWKDVLKALGNVPEAARRKLGEALLQRTAAIDDPAEHDELRTDLRKMLGKHREFQDADWAIPMDHLADFARAYDQLEPADPVWRYGWLFRNGTDAHRYRGDWSAMMAEDERRRTSALEEIVSQLGKTGVLRLLDQGARPEWVAAALMQAPSAEPLRMDMIREGLSAEDGPGWQMARSCIFAALETSGRTWIDPLLATALANSDDERAAARLLLVLKGEPCVWRLAEEAGSLVEAAYWRGVSPWALSDERDHLIFAVEKLKAFGRPRVAAHLIAAKLDRQLPVDLIVGVLRAAVGDSDHAFGADNEPEMWTYNLEQVLQHLGARDDADEATMIELEWRYYEILQHTLHQAPRLQAALANDPAFFLMILKLVYAPAEESGIVEPELENSEQMAAIVKQGWRLLDDWNRVPGATDHGEIDPAALNAWVETVRSGAEAVGRLAVAEIRLGKVLARAPKTSDGAWPPPPVCALLETLEGEELGDAFILGVINKRGVTVRMPNDGGALERAEAAHYRAAGAAIRARYPKTAALLERVAKNYDDHAQREDVQAEQRDIL